MRVYLVLLAACSSASSAPSPLPAAPTVDRSTPAPGLRPRVAAAPVNAQPVGDPAVTDPVTAVRFVIAVDDAPAADRHAYARADQTVTLYAVIEAGRAIYSDAPSLRLAGKPVNARPLATGPAVELAWNRVEPVSANYSNGGGSSFHFHRIDYEATAIAGTAGKGAITADVRPTLTPDHGGGVGTMRFQLVATQGERVVASPGPDARRGTKGSGGLSDAVLRVSIRTDDTYLGYLTEMYGQPYVWASAGLSDRSHQSERLEGSDCADFIVYGARRMGADLPYMWTGALPQVTRLLGAGTRGEDGIYRDRRGVPVPYTRAGDLVLFPRHVGALTEDRGTPGVLDDQDLMMHTLFDSPKQQAIADSGYADTPVEVRRFRRDLRPGR